MFTGTSEELRDREQQARALAEQVASLLNQIEDLGLGPANGEVHVPGARVRFIDEWTVTD